MGGLTTTEDMRFYSISAKMNKKASNKGKPLVVQFSVKHEEHQYAFCGGGYLKLLPDKLKQATFGGDDEYNIMFGPDLCGYDVSHIHLIFNHKGENLLKDDKISLEYADKNEFTHLYTAIIQPTGEYEVLFDNESKSKGKLIDEWAFPKEKIDDPDDKKPADWVDEKMIADPADKKPEGYDDIPAQIPDPKYEAGVQLANYETMYVGFELWTVNNGTIFDNILVTDDADYAKKQGEELWKPTKEGETDKKAAWDKENKPETPEEDEDMDDMDEEDEDLDEEPEKDEL